METIFDLDNIITQLGETLLAKDWHLVTAESCTGGMIGAYLTDRAGSSAWFDAGFITYSNAAKEDMLGVLPQTLATYGAVSEQTVLEMATGALARSRADMAIAVTGIAGPDGGSDHKPVGTVWLAWALKHQMCVAKCYHFKGDRRQVREQTVHMGLQTACTFL